MLGCKDNNLSLLYVYETHERCVKGTDGTVEWGLDHATGLLRRSSSRDVSATGSGDESYQWSGPLPVSPSWNTGGKGHS